MRCRWFFLASFCLAILLPPAAVAEPVLTSIPLRTETGKPVVDGVFLNGHGPYRFLLDTGSQSNHLDSSLAHKLGIAATLQFQLGTPSGESTVPGGRVGKVTLGAAEAEDQEFLFTHFSELPNLPPDVRGILGQEFLTHFDYTLDFQHHRLTFGESLAAGAQTSFRLVFGVMAVPTNLGELMLDSGAEMLFLFRDPTRAASAEMTGSTGAKVAVAIDSAPELRIGERRYHPVRAAYHAVPAVEQAGLLPANLFHAIFVSNSSKFVVFDPLP